MRFGRGLLLEGKVEVSSPKNIRLGEKVRLGKDVYLGVWPDGKLIMGDNTYIGRWSIILAHQSVTIGDDCLVAPGCHITDVNHGSKPKYYHKFVGGNFRLDTIHAAALLVKLPLLDKWSEMRRANAAKYNKLFAGFDKVQTPAIRDYATTIFNQYVIRVPKRNELQAFLKEQGIGTEVYYPVSMHEQECFKALGYKKGDFPESEKAAADSLALPIYSELSDEQIAYVAGKVKEFCSR